MWVRPRGVEGAEVAESAGEALLDAGLLAAGPHCTLWHLDSLRSVWRVVAKYAEHLLLLTIYIKTTTSVNQKANCMTSSKWLVSSLGFYFSQSLRSFGISCSFSENKKKKFYYFSTQYTVIAIILIQLKRRKILNFIFRY